MEGEAGIFEKIPSSPSNPPFAQKLLNRQNRTSESLNAACSSCSVQTLPRLNGMKGMGLWSNSFLKLRAFSTETAQKDDSKLLLQKFPQNPVHLE